MCTFHANTISVPYVKWRSPEPVINVPEGFRINHTSIFRHVLLYITRNIQDITQVSLSFLHRSDNIKFSQKSLRLNFPWKSNFPDMVVREYDVVLYIVGLWNVMWVVLAVYRVSYGCEPHFVILWHLAGLARISVCHTLCTIEVSDILTSHLTA
jgi:hypothetical protein